MFEDALHSRLSADANIQAVVSTYQGAPAIFSDVAPEEAERPYITFTIERNINDMIALCEFTVDVDYWAYGDSRVDARAAVEYIEFSLDIAQLSNARYDKIRFYTPSSGPVNENDPRAIHYNVQFDVRASRKKWMGQL